MKELSEYPESVRDRIPGLLRVPGRRPHHVPVVAKAAEDLWRALSPKEKMGYLLLLQLQILQDAEAVTELMAEAKDKL